MSSPAIRAAACGALCLAILVGMLLSHAWPLWTGETIHLRVRPVDPRDPFRGDYVRLSYDVNRLEIGESGALRGDGDGDRVSVVPLGGWREELRRRKQESRRRLLRGMRDRILYVQLEPSIGEEPALYRAVSVSDTPQPATVNLQGRVRSVYPPSGPEGTWTLEMHYGIDALYVQERTGLELEAAIARGDDVVAAIAVTASGRARLRELIVQEPVNP
jgi:uncharacterized membrane-anchored protein